MQRNFPDVFCSVGTHPHHAAEEPEIDAKTLIELPSIRKSSPSARPASTITTTTARATLRSKLPPTYCRGTRNRTAAGDPFARLRRRHGAHSRRGNGQGRLPGGAALLHRRPRPGLHRASTSAIMCPSPAFSPSSVPTSCAPSPRRCRPTACWSKPTRRISRRCHIAASATSRPMWSKPPRCWRKRAAFRLRVIADRPRRISSAVQQGAAHLGQRRQKSRMSLTFTILGCGSSMGVPRVALGWGACDPNNPKNRRRRCSLLVERARRRWRHARAGRLHAGSARAIARRPDRLARRRALHPRARRPHPRHRRPAPAIREKAPPRRRLYGRADLARHADRASAIASPVRPAATIRRSSREHRLVPGEPVSIDGQGGAIEALPVLQEHGDIAFARLPLRQRRLFRRHQERCRRRACRLAGLDVWIVDALRSAPHPSHMNLDEALDWIGRVKPEAGDPHQPARDLDYEVLRAQIAGEC